MLTKSSASTTDMHGISSAGASRTNFTRLWNRFGYSKTAPRRGAKHVTPSSKVGPVAVLPSQNHVAIIRLSQYLTTVSEVLSDSHKTTLRPDDAQYLIRLVTTAAPFSSLKTSMKPLLAPGVSSYPPALMREYDLLTDKKLRRTISSLELKRLQEVRNQIASIDEQRSIPDTWMFIPISCARNLRNFELKSMPYQTQRLFLEEKLLLWRPFLQNRRKQQFVDQAEEQNISDKLKNKDVDVERRAELERRLAEIRERLTPPVFDRVRRGERPPIVLI